MIIDFHTHIFPPEVIADRAGFAARDPFFAELYASPKARMATAADLIAAMDRNGIASAVTFGFGWRDPGLIRLANDAVIDAVREYPDRLIGFAVAQPAQPGAAEEVERCVEAGLRGIGELMPHGQGYRLRDTALVRPMMHVAEERDLIVLTHASEPVGHTYPGKGDVGVADLLAFLAAFPLARVVAAHWGGGLPFFLLMPEVAQIAARCWFDTAASPFLYDPAIFRAAIAAMGAKKILFATDYPLIGYARMRRYLAAAHLTPEETAKIQSGNALALLGISPEQQEA